VQLELARRLCDTPEQFTTPELVALAEALIQRQERGFQSWNKFCPNRP